MSLIIRYSYPFLHRLGDGSICDAQIRWQGTLQIRRKETRRQSDRSARTRGSLARCKWISNRIYAFHDGVSAGRAAPAAGKRPPARWAERLVALVVVPSGDRGGPRKYGPCGWEPIQKHKDNKSFKCDWKSH